MAISVRGREGGETMRKTKWKVESRCSQFSGAENRENKIFPPLISNCFAAGISPQDHVNKTNFSRRKARREKWDRIHASRNERIAVERTEVIRSLNMSTFPTDPAVNCYRDRRKRARNGAEEIHKSITSQTFWKEQSLRSIKQCQRREATNANVRTIPVNLRNAKRPRVPSQGALQNN